MSPGADSDLGHQADILQHVVAAGGMGFNKRKFRVVQFAGFVENAVWDPDLSDVVHQCDIMVLFNRFVVIAQLAGEHLGILGHAEGVALGVGILQVDHFGECFDDLAGKLFVPLLPLDQRIHFVGAACADIQTHTQQEATDQEQPCDDGDPDDIAGDIILYALHGKIGADVADAFAA